MGFNTGIIIGSGNTLPSSDADTKISAINVTDTEFTDADDGIIFLQEKKVSVNPDGDIATEGDVTVGGDVVVTGKVNSAPSREQVEVNTNTSPTVREYFVDASGGNIAITISDGDESEHVFWKIDSSSNTVTIAHGTLNINGAASVDLTAQYERRVTSYNNGEYYST